jgi:hypothetical protein
MNSFAEGSCDLQGPMQRYHEVFFILLICVSIIFSMIAEGCADPSTTDMKIIKAKAIRDQIKSGINCDRCKIEGDIYLDIDPKQRIKYVDSPINITNSYINGTVNFSDIHFAKQINFSKTIFAGKVNFHNSSFRDEACFKGANFTMPTQFSDATFNKVAQFSGSNYRKRLQSGKVEFRGKADFNNSNFIGEADFSQCNFTKNAYFCNCNFTGDAIFPYTKFHGDTFFIRSVYHNKFDYFNATFLDNTYFYDTISNKKLSRKLEANFGNTKFFNYCNFTNISFDSANFLYSIFQSKAEFNNASFTGGLTDFSQANFSNTVYFSGAKFLASDTEFNNSIFRQYVDFKEASFNSNTSFGGTTFGLDSIFLGSHFRRNVDFTSSRILGNGNFKDSQFEGSINLDDARFTGDVSFENPKFQNNSRLHLNRTQFDKIYLRWKEINGTFFKDCRLIYNEEAYLSLIKGYKTLGWIGDANECYLEYKIKSRSNIPMMYRIPDFIVCSLYGYGVKPEYTIFWSSIFIITYGLFFWKNDKKRINDAMTFSWIVFLSGTGKLLVDKPEYKPIYRAQLARILFNSERLIGGFLIFLFFIAITRTVSI